MSKGFLWFCQNNQKTDYVKLSILLAESIKRYNKENKITPTSIKKNIQEIIENTAEQDHVTVDIENTKEMVGKDLDKHLKTLEKKMNEFASKLEFEDAARLRDEINRLRAKEVGLSNKILEFRKK